MKYTKSAVVYSSNSVQEVHLKRALLEGEGIPCFISDDNTSTWFPHLTHAIGGVKLHVASDLESSAREVLNLYRPVISYPECDSKQSTFINCAPFWSTLASIFFGFPLPIHKQPYYHCSSCGHRWAPQPKEKQPNEED